MATEEDRSLRGGMSLPMWMRSNSKSRLHDRLDFNESTFSPPENDDNFLYIKYPQMKENNAAGTDHGTITINGNGIASTTLTTQLDVNKHTAPCRDSIIGKQETPKSQILTSNGKIKSVGTDEAFKEDGACGSSVIRVATQMVSGKVVRGFDSFEEEEQEHMKSIGFDPRLRRGSRSLPASPLQSPNTSPKSKRKAVNKYFTGAYADDKKPGSILANLLQMQKRDFSKSVASISEESEMVMKMKGISMEDVSKNAAAAGATGSKPKPSHLREMNFWSPTSM